MTSNVTAVLESKPSAATLLWVPHVVIAVSFLTFLAFNFYCYHMKYKQRYQRKSDESEIKARLKERRRILNIVKLRHMITPQIPASASALSKKNFKVTSDFKKASTLTAKMESTLTSKSSSNLQVLDCPFSVSGKPFDAISV